MSVHAARRRRCAIGLLLTWGSSGSVSARANEYKAEDAQAAYYRGRRVVVGPRGGVAVPEGRTQFPVYMDTLRLFKRGEIVTICKTALNDGPLDTRELALAVIKAKGLDAKDAVLRRSIAFRIVQALSLQAKRRKLTMLPKRKGVRVWKL